MVSKRKRGTYSSWQWWMKGKVVDVAVDVFEWRRRLIDNTEVMF